MTSFTTVNSASAALGAYAEEHHPPSWSEARRTLEAVFGFSNREIDELFAQAGGDPPRLADAVAHYRCNGLFGALLHGIGASSGQPDRCGLAARWTEQWAQGLSRGPAESAISEQQARTALARRVDPWPAGIAGLAQAGQGMAAHAYRRREQQPAGATREAGAAEKKYWTEMARLKRNFGIASSGDEASPAAPPMVSRPAQPVPLPASDKSALIVDDAWPRWKLLDDMPMPAGITPGPWIANDERATRSSASRQVSVSAIQSSAAGSAPPSDSTSRQPAAPGGRFAPAPAPAIPRATAGTPAHDASRSASLPYVRFLQKRQPQLYQDIMAARALATSTEAAERQRGCDALRRIGAARAVGPEGIAPARLGAATLHDAQERQGLVLQIQGLSALGGAPLLEGMLARLHTGHRDEILVMSKVLPEVVDAGDDNPLKALIAIAPARRDGQQSVIRLLAGPLVNQLFSYAQKAQDPNAGSVQDAQASLAMLASVCQHFHNERNGARMAGVQHPRKPPAAIHRIPSFLLQTMQAHPAPAVRATALHSFLRSHPRGQLEFKHLLPAIAAVDPAQSAVLRDASGVQLLLTVTRSKAVAQALDLVFSTADAAQFCVALGDIQDIPDANARRVGLNAALAAKPELHAQILQAVEGRMILPEGHGSADMRQRVITGLAQYFTQAGESIDATTQGIIAARWRDPIEQILRSELPPSPALEEDAAGSRKEAQFAGGLEAASTGSARGLEPADAGVREMIRRLATSSEPATRFAAVRALARMAHQLDTAARGVLGQAVQPKLYSLRDAAVGALAHAGVADAHPNVRHLALLYQHSWALD